MHTMRSNRRRLHDICSRIIFASSVAHVCGLSACLARELPQGLWPATAVGPQNAHVHASPDGPGATMARGMARGRKKCCAARLHLVAEEVVQPTTRTPLDRCSILASAATRSLSSCALCASASTAAVCLRHCAASCKQACPMQALHSRFTGVQRSKRRSINAIHIS